MEQLLDLDKLHRTYRRQRIRNAAVGCLFVMLVIFAGGWAIRQKTPASHKATITNTASVSPVSSDPAGTSPPSVATGSTNSASNLSQEAEQEKALAAKEEAEANQEIANIQKEQQTLSSEIPPPAPTTAPVQGVQLPDPSLCPGIQQQEQSATASISAQSQQVSSDLSELQAAQEADIQGGNYAAADQLNAGIQNDINQLNANLSQVESIDAPYQTQLAANECS